MFQMSFLFKKNPVEVCPEMNFQNCFTHKFASFILNLILILRMNKFSGHSFSFALFKSPGHFMCKSDSTAEKAASRKINSNIVFLNIAALLLSVFM